MGGVAAGGQTRRRAAAQADAHARAAKLHQQRACGKCLFVRHAGIDGAQATGEHDGLVITPDLAVHRLFEHAEVPGKIGTAELVVERRAAQRPVEHDLQRAGGVTGLAECFCGRLPRFASARQPQIGDRKPGEPRLGARATAGGALVANLSTGSGGRTGKRRNGGGVIVRFHLHQHMLEPFLCAVAVRGGIGLPGLHRAAFHHRGIVGIGHHRALRRHRVGVADHLEQGVRLIDAIDGEASIENFVAAMFAVGLGEHHQLDIGGVAAELAVGVEQIVDLVIRQRQSLLHIGTRERRAAGVKRAGEHVHVLQRLGWQFGKKTLQLAALQRHGFGHAVVQQGGELKQFGLGQRFGGAQQPALRLKAVLHRAFHPVHLGAAQASDVGGLGSPGRKGAQARHDIQALTLCGTGVRIAIAQQAFEFVVKRGSRGGVERHRMHIAGMNTAHAIGDLRRGLAQAGLQCVLAKRGQGAGAFKEKDVHAGSLNGLGGVGDGGQRQIIEIAMTHTGGSRTHVRSVIIAP